jgi:hypothetical protein
MSNPQNNDTGVPRRHAPSWVQQEAARTQRYSEGQPVRIEEPSDVFATLVPTKNPQALMGYYFAVFSILPLIGLGLGPMAIWKGIRGLGAIKENPELPGKAHGIVAITLGSITTIGHWLTLMFVLYSLLSPKR